MLVINTSQNIKDIPWFFMKMPVQYSKRSKIKLKERVYLIFQCCGMQVSLGHMIWKLLQENQF